MRAARKPAPVKPVRALGAASPVAVGVEAAPAAPSIPRPLSETHAQGVPAASPAAPVQPPAPARYEDQFSLPSGYGEDRVVLMVKDPWWIYAYWEIRPETERATRSALRPEEIPGLRSILRVYDVTGAGEPSATQSVDVVLSGLATNWFIHTNAPGHAYLVEIGLLTARGRFVPLARSNRVTTPRFGPSDDIDEAWAMTDEAYWTLFSLAAGQAAGSSPTAWAQGFAQRYFSSGWSSMGLVGAASRPAIRGFWCRVSADLVIHGTTEPRATVRIQEQPVPVRKDGSFSVRMALPDGTQSIPIEVTSADGHVSRIITPIVALSWGASAQPDPTQAPPRPDVIHGMGESSR